MDNKNLMYIQNGMLFWYKENMEFTNRRMAETRKYFIELTQTQKFNCYLFLLMCDF